MKLFSTPSYLSLFLRPCNNSLVRSHITIRNSTLSAIHRGIHAADKATSKGVPPRRWDPKVAARVTERRKARLAAPVFKLRKGKKDIREEIGPVRPTRASRFNDPEDSFGKRSFVYQLKNGDLKDKLRSLRSERLASEREREREPRPGGSSEASRPSDWSSRRPPREKRDDNVRDSRDNRGYKNDLQGRGRRLPGRRNSVGQADREYSRLPDREYPSRSESEYSSRSAREFSEVFDRAVNPTRAPSGPVSIDYTTAASQFLYGKSVVLAALQASRRKLYTLYSYAGQTSMSSFGSDRNQSIIDFAESKGVKVKVLDSSHQQLMRKLSEGRPHNGLILEASPLPQWPVEGLGQLSVRELRPGYLVNLGHQSSEEASVNGTLDFVPTSSLKYKPLVLLLDQIQDPGNMGAILRTASFLGVSAVAISKGSDLTGVVTKASAGAAETMPLFSVNDPTSFLNASKRHGWKVYAAMPHDVPQQQIKHMDLDGIEERDPLTTDPCILVLGSEGKGLDRPLKRLADVRVTIPNLSGSTVVDSLNVSVAAGLLCSSFLRQRSRSRFDMEKVEMNGTSDLW